MGNELVPLTRETPLATIRHGADVLGAWLAGRNASTVEAYLRDLKDFASFLLGKKEPDLAAAVDAFLALGRGRATEAAIGYRANLNQRGKSGATICRRLSTLRSMVRAAAEIERVAWGLTVKGPKVENLRDTTGPGEEGYRRMRAAVRRVAEDNTNARESARAKRDFAMMLLMHDMVLRRGSCAALDLDDLSLDSDPPWIEVTLKGQTDKKRKTLPWQNRDALKAWIAVRGRKPGPLFVRLDAAAGNDLGRMDGESINRAVRRAGERAELSRSVHAHGLRHQGITRALVLTNGNIAEVQMLADHVKPETTQKYNDNRLNVGGKLAQMLADD